MRVKPWLKFEDSLEVVREVADDLDDAVYVIQAVPVSEQGRIFIHIQACQLEI